MSANFATSQRTSLRGQRTSLAGCDRRQRASLAMARFAVFAPATFAADLRTSLRTSYSAANFAGVALAQQPHRPGAPPWAHQVPAVAWYLQLVAWHGTSSPAFTSLDGVVDSNTVVDKRSRQSRDGLGMLTA